MTKLQTIQNIRKAVKLYNTAYKTGERHVAYLEADFKLYKNSDKTLASKMSKAEINAWSLELAKSIV